ncbi:MAG TPA: leucyl/phenylalanyl-tRNA--protein transferase [Acidimicrobiales bacterium]|nr:leucyl/phenylalanyl-tRNA--protein transferase [Acidimicrobiales bacterium]
MQTERLQAGPPRRSTSPHPGAPLARLAVSRPTPAVEPPGTRWIFPAEPPPGADPPARDGETPEQGRPGEVVGIGADLEPGTLLSAYRSGVFPMPVRRGLMAWWSPDPRGIIPLDGLRVSRSLRRSCRRYTIRVDTAFEEVIGSCGDGSRRGAWIDDDIRAAYIRLHRWGWAHSVEAWDEYGRLSGGLYGVSIGGLFAGESMFHRRTDASKVALVALVELLAAAGATLLDVQWVTPHLESLGAIAVPRREYLAQLGRAVLLPQPPLFGGPQRG